MQVLLADASAFPCTTSAHLILEGLGAYAWPGTVNMRSYRVMDIVMTDVQARMMGSKYGIESESDGENNLHFEPMREKEPAIGHVLVYRRQG